VLFWRRLHLPILLLKRKQFHCQQRNERLELARYFNETEGATDGKFSLNHRLLEHCTTLAVGADTEWVESQQGTWYHCYGGAKEPPLRSQQGPLRRWSVYGWDLDGQTRCMPFAGHMGRCLTSRRTGVVGQLCEGVRLVTTLYIRRCPASHYI